MSLHLPFYGLILGKIELFCVLTMPGMPSEVWWLAGLVLLILGLAAMVDAFTATVPDGLVLLGLLAVTLVQGVYVSWPYASHHLVIAIACAMALWGLNHLWYLIFRHDGFGMGDAKWTMLAVACFGFQPALWAWGVGACLAIVWLSLAWIVRHPINRVYFAPFLFIGLIAALWWFRTRGM